ncbi:hypothetical protein TD95_001364 [Thielaviopsis punctulata]|uniref:Rhodopsin domain-containing protein n=1 Tax=Thielaviopsis punctulata TaxID=72032 RepID=A0A0F4ZII5_9PEZI|nr:hypothetical protein TD95_001364 [Thielaviopsis punctulata]
MLPWKIIWDLQMKTKEKIGVGVAMSMGVFAATTAFIKASKIPSLSSGDFTYYGAELVIWSAAEVGTTVMAASIPILRVLITHMKTSYVHNSAEKRSNQHSVRPSPTRSGAGPGGSGSDTLAGSVIRKTGGDEDVLVTKDATIDSRRWSSHSDYDDLPSAGGESSATMHSEMDFSGGAGYELRAVGQIV